MAQDAASFLRQLRRRRRRRRRGGRVGGGGAGQDVEEARAVDEAGVAAAVRVAGPEEVVEAGVVHAQASGGERGAEVVGRDEARAGGGGRAGRDGAQLGWAGYVHGGGDVDVDVVEGAAQRVEEGARERGERAPCLAARRAAQVRIFYTNTKVADEEDFVYAGIGASVELREDPLVVGGELQADVGQDFGQLSNSGAIRQKRKLTFQANQDLI